MNCPRITAEDKTCNGKLIDKIPGKLKVCSKCGEEYSKYRLKKLTR